MAILNSTESRGFSLVGPVQIERVMDRLDGETADVSHADDDDE